MFIRYLLKHVYKQIKRLVLVEDNLNTHNRKTLIDILGEEGKRIAQKIEWHFTPKHGSWLDQAEIEIHALEQQCLKRNQDKCGINWQFTREKAREKFHLEQAL